MTRGPVTRGSARVALDGWEALMSAHRGLSKIFGAEDHVWHELSMKEYDVLYTLAKADGPLRLCDLSDGVLLSQPALSRMVDRLIDRELIHRSPDPEDGRAVRLSLTAEGARLQKEIGWAHGRSILREFRDRLNPEDQAELLRICSLLAADPSPEEDSHG